MSVNHELRRLLASTDLLEFHWRYFLHSDDRDVFNRAFAHAVIARRPFSVSVRVLIGDSYRWCFLGAVPSFDHDGRVLEYYVAVRDSGEFIHVSDRAAEHPA